MVIELIKGTRREVTWKRYEWLYQRLWLLLVLIAIILDSANDKSILATSSHLRCSRSEV